MKKEKRIYHPESNVRSSKCDFSADVKEQKICNRLCPI